MMVLVAEDDIGVRLLLWNALREQGHTVLHASDGNLALDLARQHQGPIDLLLTDLEMPTMSGCELYHALRADYPNLKTVFLAGSLSNHANGNALLGKPFTMAQLYQTIDRALDSSNSPGPSPVTLACPVFQTLMDDRCRSCFSRPVA